MPRFKVAYVHPAPHGRASRSHIPLDGFQNIPAGLPGALNAVRAGSVELVGVNEAIELRLDPSFSLAAWLRAQAPDLVLVELHWYVHTHGARHAVVTARETLPGVPILLGGLTATAFAPEILQRWHGADMVLEGEAEVPLVQVVDHLRRKLPMRGIPNLWVRAEGKVTPPAARWSARDLEGLDHVDISWLQHREEFERSDFPYRNRWLLVGRGCPHACFFCGGSGPSLARSFGRDDVLIRPAHSVVADIVRLACSGVEAVHLTHDLFSLGRAYWEELFRGVRRAGVHVGLGNESWGPIPDDEVLEAWAQTFDVTRSYIALSPTSAWSGLAALASKKPDASALFRALERMASHRFPLHVFFLLNIPGETTETFQKTIDFASAILERYPRDLLRLEIQPAPIDPRSPAALGLTRGFRFRQPTLDDYLAVSRGDYVPDLSWPVECGAVDPGVPVEVPPARPRQIMALSARCPSFADRWRDLVRLERRGQDRQTEQPHPATGP